MDLVYTTRRTLLALGSLINNTEYFHNSFFQILLNTIITQLQNDSDYYTKTHAKTECTLKFCFTHSSTPDGFIAFTLSLS